MAPQIHRKEEYSMDPKEIYMSKPWLAFYPEDVPPTVEIPEISVPEFLDRTAQEFQKNTALIFYGI